MADAAGVERLRARFADVVEREGDIRAITGAEPEVTAGLAGVIRDRLS